MISLCKKDEEYDNSPLFLSLFCNPSRSSILQRQIRYIYFK